MLTSPCLSHKNFSSQTLDMKKVGCIVLSGGQGTRLFPLTKTRPKPGVPFGGYYRLIDFALSNAKHAQCGKIWVLTQFFSSPLHQHIYKTYTPHLHGHLEILTAEERPAGYNWYQGTADAVRQNIEYLKESSVDYFLILSGDQVYRLNFLPMLAFARQTDADLVIASVPVEEANARRMGLLRLDEDGAIRDFYEKPRDPTICARFSCPLNIREQLRPSTTHPLFLGSMGIYLFKRDTLLRLLEEDPREDFGKHLIPSQVSRGNTFAYLYDGYWEDIGTLESFYHANLALTQSSPPFSFYTEQHPFHMEGMQLPPAKILQAKMTRSIVCAGSLIEGDEISSSLIGPRTFIKSETSVFDSYVMGNPSYTQEDKPITIGKRCCIRRAILDTNVSLGDDVTLVNRDNLETFDSPGVHIRDGIIVVSRGVHLPDGYTL